MTKKIFIAGAVRVYDSANPQAFIDEIVDFIRKNIVGADSADDVVVAVQEPHPDRLIIEFQFRPTDDPLNEGWVSDGMYQCFFGLCKTFEAKFILPRRINFGPQQPSSQYVHPDDIADAHKRNTKFYEGDKYKGIFIEERPTGLTVIIQF